MNSLPHHHNEIDVDALQKELNKTERFEIVSNYFRLLDDPNRLRLFWLLCHYEECVTDLAALMNMSSPALSHHLRALKAGGLIVSKRKGKEVYYSASKEEDAQLLHKMIEKLTNIACPKDPLEE